MRNVLWLVILIIGCACLGIDVQSSSHSAAHSTPPQPHRLSQGEALYLRHCAGCHGWEGQGDGPLASVFEVKAPRLREEERLAQSSEAELMARILYGRELAIPFNPQVLAPSDEEVAALLAYLRRLPTIPWAEIRQGQNIYDSLCVYCHGIYGHGDGIIAQQLPIPPRDLRSPAFQHQVSDADMLRVITDGKGAMPGMGEIMSAKDVQTVVAFVRLLSPAFEQYNRLCAACHGPDGHPPARPLEDTEDDAALEEVPTVVFNQTYFRTRSEAYVRDWVRHMLRQSRAIMPHFAGELSKDEIRHILAYLRSLP
ncbi:MAG TPA: c-type cytochrome [Candidatus Tectomicrobia bacterium]